ncbi:MAG: FMN-binding protein [Planctomycetota bacterium]
MFKHLLRLILALTMAAGLSMLAVIAGCMDSVADSREQMEMVLETFPSTVEVSEIPASRGAESSQRPGAAGISEIKGASGPLGYCVESEVAGRSGPFRIRVLVDPQLVIVRAAVISYPWTRGRDVCTSAFSDQFRGKGPGDSIEVGEDIDAMSGATISCDAMTGGVREALRLLEHVKSTSSQNRQK